MTWLQVDPWLDLGSLRLLNPSPVLGSAYCLWLSGHEFKQTLGESEGHGSLVCCSPWGDKELDMMERLNKKHCSHTKSPFKFTTLIQWGVFETIWTKYMTEPSKYPSFYIYIYICIYIINRNKETEREKQRQREKGGYLTIDIDMKE